MLKAEPRMVLVSPPLSRLAAKVRTLALSIAHSKKALEHFTTG